MRKLLLLAFGFTGVLSHIHAQDAAPATNVKIKQPTRQEFIFESGFNFCFTPDIVLSNTTVSASSSHVGLGTGILLKYIPFQERFFGIGLRLGLNNLKVWKDGYVRYTNGTIDEVAAKYANPLLQIGLQGHFTATLSSKVSLRLSPFAGYGHAWSSNVDQDRNQSVSAIPVGNSSGWNAGFDVSLGIEIHNQFSVTISSGYQRSWMRFATNNPLTPGASGFNITHIPLNIGIGIGF